MLSAIRNFAKSWVAAILIGLLILSFAVWGINDVFTGNVGDQVVKAGSRVVSSADFRREYDNYRRRLEEQSGQTITPEMAAANGLDRVVLGALATREAFAEMLHRMGARPSDRLLVAEIEKIPAFFDPISGRFDKATYQQRIGELGLTPQMFDRVLADEMAVQHFSTAAAAGLRAPRAYGAFAAIYALETRDLAYFTVTAASVAQPPAPTDEQLTAFMKENAAQLTRPEMRVLTVVRFSPRPTGAEPIDEADLKKLYDFRKDTFSTPETRTLVQIPAKDQAAAKQIAERLGRGEPAATIAKSLGVDAITYEDRPRTAIADRRIGEAAFKMPAGEVATVQGELGLAVVKVVSVSAGRDVTLEEARPMLEAELRKTAAAERVYEQTQAYEDAHQAGASLADAAQKAGAPVTTLGPVTASGVTEEGAPAAGLTPRILEQAFSLPAGGESDLSEAGEGEYFAVRVERVIPAAMPPLAEVRADLARAWTLREVARRMEARAEELAARVRKGEDLQAVAASAGLRVSEATDLSRRTANERSDLSGEVLGRAFGAKPGDVFVTRAREFGFAVGQVDNVRVMAGPDAAQAAEGSRPEITQTLFREIADAAQAASREKLKVRTDVNRARAAVGMEPLAPEGKAETTR